MDPDAASAAYENEGQRALEAMDKFRAHIADAITWAELAGLYMPAVITDLEITLDELKEKYPNDNY